MNAGRAVFCSQYVEQGIDMAFDSGVRNPQRLRDMMVAAAGSKHGKHFLLSPSKSRGMT